MISPLASAARPLRRHRPHPDLPALILLTDDRRLPDPAPLLSRLPRGSWVIVRRQEAGEREKTARRIGPECRRRGLRLLIANDPALAAKLRADGLHLPQSLAWRATARRWVLARGGILSVAAHDRRALRAAAHLGADGILLSPVFPTLSHPGGKVLGALRFANLCRSEQVAIYALGGVTVQSAKHLRRTRAAGLAAIGGI